MMQGNQQDLVTEGLSARILTAQLGSTTELTWGKFQFRAQLPRVPLYHLGGHAAHQGGDQGPTRVKPSVYRDVGAKP